MSAFRKAVLLANAKRTALATVQEEKSCGLDDLSSTAKSILAAAAGDAVKLELATWPTPRPQSTVVMLYKVTSKSQKTDQVYSVLNTDIVLGAYHIDMDMKDTQPLSMTGDQLVHRVISGEFEPWPDNAFFATVSFKHAKPDVIICRRVVSFIAAPATREKDVLTCCTNSKLYAVLHKSNAIEATIAAANVVSDVCSSTGYTWKVGSDLRELAFLSVLFRANLICMLFHTVDA